MSRARTLASPIALLSGAISAYAGYTSAAPEGNPTILAAVGALLALNSLACFYGVRNAFAASAGIAAVFAALAYIAWPSLSSVQLLALVMSAVCVAASLVAFRASSRLSEQGNPMNLPVFG